ncbi:MAG TPA: ABC transporter ATP-binding protein [Thermomicrobiales bacterium]|nr:ABC transporter ATP-binding protein [Thermomicrobiales bacterium]
MQVDIIDRGMRREEAPGIALSAERVVKRFGTGDAGVVALDDVSVGFASRRMTAIMGPSGSGKSTLMHCLAGLDGVTSGRIALGEHELSGMSDQELTVLRREHLGFVFQSFNLLPAFNAEQNIMLPLELAGVKPDREWFRTLVSTLGIHDRLRHRPSELSGGQQQRVAIARALINRPDVVFCDEPTGSLDSRSGQEVLSFLRESVDRFGQTVLMVTHDPRAAAIADRVVFLADGRIVGEDTRPTTDSVLEALRDLGA